TVAACVRPADVTVAQTQIFNNSGSSLSFCTCHRPAPALLLVAHDERRGWGGDSGEVYQEGARPQGPSSRLHVSAGGDCGAAAAARRTDTPPRGPPCTRCDAMLRPNVSGGRR